MTKHNHHACLSSFLNDNEIPSVKSHLGFLEIIRKSHNETINSNLYAYFLSCDEHHIKGLFLETLLDLLSSKLGKEKELNFNNYVVNTEVSTNLGRVDIVVEDLLSQSTIIIENKIYHNIKNPLEDYWEHFKINEEWKVGILLTLHPHDIPDEVEGKFINITHWEWISKVKSSLVVDKIKSATLKLYLTDFIKTIENMSTTNQLNESAKFFFENAKKVNQAYETIIEGHRFMIEQYRLIASKLGLNEYGNDISFRNFWDESNKIDTYFTLTTHDIIQGEGFKYNIIIELFRDDRDRLEDLRTKFSNYDQYKDKVEGKIAGHYTHFLVKEYETSLEDMHNFADHVVNNIKKDFGKIYIEIVEFLYPDFNTSELRKNLSTGG